jgi:hypothetical protein
MERENIHVATTVGKTSTIDVEAEAEADQGPGQLRARGDLSEGHHHKNFPEKCASTAANHFNASTTGGVLPTLMGLLRPIVSTLPNGEFVACIPS